MLKKLRKTIGSESQKPANRQSRVWLNRDDMALLKVSVGTALLLMIMILVAERDNRSFSTLMDALWWAVVTITTTGYGDQVPLTTSGRVVAMLAMIFGVVVVSIITGRISSYLVDKKLQEGRGLKKLKHLSDHILICGWKNDIKYLILDILRYEKNITMDDLVLINSMDPDRMTAFLMDESLKGIHYLSGDSSSEAVLMNANIKLARKALVLSEFKENEDVEAVDSRVLVTVLLLRSLNPRIYICAEVQTVKYKNYLEHLKCDEVVLSEEYTRFLLANATVYSGITKVVSKLLNNDEGATIKLVHLDPYLEDKSFGEISEHYKKAHSSMTIGVVENMGIERDFKQNALSDAQKASDISTLVKNLKNIKDMERNRTLINPPDDYIVRRHSGLIVIGR